MFSLNRMNTYEVSLINYKKLKYRDRILYQTLHNKYQLNEKLSLRSTYTLVKEFKIKPLCLLL